MRCGGVCVWIRREEGRKGRNKKRKLSQRDEGKGWTEGKEGRNDKKGR